MCVGVKAKLVAEDVDPYSNIFRAPCPYIKSGITIGDTAFVVFIIKPCVRSRGEA